MIMANDLGPFAGTVGGGFLIGFITGYAIKKVIKAQLGKVLGSHPGLGCSPLDPRDC